MLLKDHVFIRSVAKAIGRMPTVKRLRMSDHDGLDFLTPEYVREAFADWSESTVVLDALNNLQDTVFRRMVVPRSWDPSNYRHVSIGQPVSLLWELPVGILQSGGHLTQLDISVSGDPNAANVIVDGSRWKWDDQLHTGLTSLARGLKGFNYAGPGGFSDDKSRSFTLYLNILFTTGSKLERLSLHFTDTQIRFQGSHAVRFRKLKTSVIASMKTKSLQFVHLFGCSLEQDGFEQLLGRYDVLRPKRISLGYVALFGDTWANVFDLLRASIDEASIGKLGCNMRSTSEVTNCFTSKALLYINSDPRQERNPLRIYPTEPEEQGMSQAACVSVILLGWMSHNRHLAVDIGVL